MVAGGYKDIVMFSLGILTFDTKILPGNEKKEFLNIFVIIDRQTFPTHLTVGQLVPGLFAVGENLPEDHAEAPDVALRGELPVHDALRRHPADW